MKKKLKKELNKLLPTNYQVTENTNEWLTECSKNRFSLHFDIEEKQLKKIEPVFFIDDKPMYECDDLFFIDKNDNWKLHKLKVESQISGNYNPKAYFATKESALNYVLEDAKKRFEGKKAIYSDGSIENINELELTANSIRTKDRPMNKIFLWYEDKGWIATPIKEQPLMLSNEVVKIKKDVKVILGTPSSCTYRDEIHCKGEYVTSEQWLKWYDKIKIIVDNSITSKTWFKDWDVLFASHDKTMSIGCIKNVTFDQIEAITKKLKEI